MQDSHFYETRPGKFRGCRILWRVARLTAELERVESEADPATVQRTLPSIVTIAKARYLFRACAVALQCLPVVWAQENSAASSLRGAPRTLERWQRRGAGTSSRSVQTSHLPVSSTDSWVRNLRQANAIAELESLPAQTPETAKVRKVSTPPSPLSLSDGPRNATIAASE
jgi:hypothetical protein